MKIQKIRKILKMRGCPFQVRILFLNATYIKKELTLKTAKDLGLDITIVGLDLPDWAKSYTDRFIQANTYDYDETIQKLIIEYKNYPFHGVITFWDRDVENVAKIANHFNLRGNSVESAKLCRNKGKQRECLTKYNVSQPSYLIIKEELQLLEVKANLCFPNIIKPVSASASKGVFRNNTFKELQENYEKLVKFATPENDMMFSYNLGEYIVEEFMDGAEISVEGVVFDNQIFFAGITEKEIDPYFEEIFHAFPARLTTEQENEIFELCKEAIVAIKLNNVGFHIEVMITSDGMKIVEINGRLGGDFITTHLIPLSLGIDLTRFNLETVLYNTEFPKPTQNRGSCVKFLASNTEGRIAKLEIDEEVKQSEFLHEFMFEKEIGDWVKLPPKAFHESRLAYVITSGNDVTEAVENADAILNSVKIEWKDR